MLRCCPQLDSEEVEFREKGCVSGGVATAMLLFGAKKRFVLFPEKFEVVQELCGRGERIGGGERGVSSENLSTGQSLRRRQVGEVLGTALGYETSDEEDSDSNSKDEHPSPVNSTYKLHPHTGDGLYMELTEQVCGSFENWCERLGDGSLRRYSVEVWPQWTHPDS